MKRTLIWLAVTQVLAGCAFAPARSVQLQLPQLDSKLRERCTLPDPPPAALVDYDARDDYVQHLVLPILADCEQRRARLVEAWDRVRGAQ